MTMSEVFTPATTSCTTTIGTAPAGTQVTLSRECADCSPVANGVEPKRFRSGSIVIVMNHFHHKNWTLVRLPDESSAIIASDSPGEWTTVVHSPAPNGRKTSIKNPWKGRSRCEASIIIGYVLSDWKRDEFNQVCYHCLTKIGGESYSAIAGGAKEGKNIVQTGTIQDFSHGRYQSLAGPQIVKIAELTAKIAELTAKLNAETDEQQRHALAVVLQPQYHCLTAVIGECEKAIAALGKAPTTRGAEYGQYPILTRNVSQDDYDTVMSACLAYRGGGKSNKQVTQETATATDPMVALLESVGCSSPVATEEPKKGKKGRGDK